MGIVSQSLVEQYREEGFCVLPAAINAGPLSMLREECAYFVGYMDALLDERRVTSMGITHRGQRYFISNRFRQSRQVTSFLFNELMADVTRSLLGDSVFLFNEQWVVKGPERGMRFSWHQDSGYVKFGDPANTHRPYLSCWCALDDVDESNGTAYLLPHSRGHTRGVIHDHHQEEGSNDLVGYSGDDPGIPIVAPAGSIACFTSFNLHRSGANRSAASRRVYLAQYTADPLRSSDGSLWRLAVPFIANGKVVFAPDAIESGSVPG